MRAVNLSVSALHDGVIQREGDATTAEFRGGTSCYIFECSTFAQPLVNFASLIPAFPQPRADHHG